MSTMVNSPEEALALAFRMAGVTRAEVFPDPDLKIISKISSMVGAPTDTSHQRGFRFNNCRGEEVAVVIDRFREGWCCWAVAPTGMAIRF